MAIDIYDLPVAARERMGSAGQGLDCAAGTAHALGHSGMANWLRISGAIFSAI
ncbi:hypothetical protein MHPYR_140027 [uncultured Mycobacterium sp.]|uniref:Uncharacterized protein n=1 Tax=uncultured Mycobacterium sp. TaxID=171292 RepID=A0A1Y5P5B0_9MYCO|nr:hypothetical protein MHPYR_140027 [uncultured Mycobacterium sp.]